MGTKPYDQAFKFLAEQDPEALLLMLGAIEPGEQVTIELLPREIGVPAMLPDQPYHVSSARGERVVQVEAWTRWAALIPGRMAEYGPLHWFKYRLPVDSYVLLLTPKQAPRRQSQRGVRGVIEAGGVRLRSRFHVIRLWRLSAKTALAAQRLALLPFVPLMDGGPAELEAAATQLRGIAGEREREETALHLAVLGGLRYNPAEVLDLIGRKGMIPLERLQESSVYQFILKQGREESRRDTAIHFFRRLAAKRFPDLELETELATVRDPEALERLACELDELDEHALRQRLAGLA
ncbi:MAG: hypothetical protein HYR56_02550 [Acidobacteria bacterium]|nr:hypothetical protein [Acidobacteriota bacterium]MBI3426450.1 hypothetical protein [Acidobacteriota bacterium]